MQNIRLHRKSGLAVRIASLMLALILLLSGGIFSGAVFHAAEDGGAAGTAAADTAVTAPGTVPGTTEETDVTDFAENISLYCLEADMFLYGKEADAPFHPYALTKLVSVLVALDRVDDPDEVFTVEEGMTDRFSHRFGIEAGDSVSFADLMKLMLMRGFDDAACVLARKIGGTDENYVAMLNEKAAELGAQHTVFENPTGRGDVGTTTAADCARIGAAFTENRLAMSWAGSESLRTAQSDRPVHNCNYFLSIYYNSSGKQYLDSRVTGLIAGNTLDPRMLIASFSVGGYTYVATVMDAAPDNGCAYAYEIAKKIVNDNETALTYKRVLSRADLICEIPVIMGEGHDAVAVSPDRDFAFHVRTDSDIKREFTYTYDLDCESLEAPVLSGTKVGSLILCRDGVEVGRADLLTVANVGRSMADYYSGRVRNFVHGEVFIKTVLIAGSLGVVYVLAMAIYRGQKKKKRRERGS